MIACSPEMRFYFDSLKGNFERAYAVARQARGQGKDPETEVEIAPAADVAARVEGLVGPPGIADRIRELSKTLDREAAAFAVAKEIVLAGEGITEATGTREKLRRIEQAVRTGLALVTEGVVSAPIEGVARFQLRKNADGSDYLAVSFAGPIRGAGGTGQAFAVILADYCRQLCRIGDYRPLQDEVERVVEEINLYARRTRAGQYVPTEDEIKHMATHCPVCIDGEPSEDYEVSAKKNLKVTVVDEGTLRVETLPNKVRSGVCLVYSEGICLKAAKVLRITKKNGLDWQWVEKLIKIAKQDAQRVELKPTSKYMDEIVAGRPVFSYPMRPGGFRLRYGRTPLTGIAAKAVHPATMVLLDEFPAIGTQLKIERPGKGCIVTPCPGIEGPVAKLFGGGVVRVESVEEALALAPQVQEVLFLGDLLCNYGDFLKSNHLLVPPGYCEEWHSLELEKAGVKKSVAEIKSMAAKQAIELSRERGLPLAPRFTYFWNDASPQGLRELVDWLAQGSLDYEWFELKRIVLAPNAKAKRVLEELCVPHRVEGEKVIVERDDALALLSSLGLLDNNRVNTRAFDAAFSFEKTALQVVNEASGLRLMDKGGVFIGASMGRPEKAKPRKMKPPVHALFPVGLHGGKIRGLVKAVKAIGESDVKTVDLELGYRACVSCNASAWNVVCEACGGHTLEARKCSKCGRLFEAGRGECACGGSGALSGQQQILFENVFRRAVERAGSRPSEVKGVMGLISGSKTPEPLEKGILRAANDVSVFRDGTIRFDATEIPLTHFTCEMAGISAGEARALGYVKDVDGKEITGEQQWIELKPQDLILNEEAGDYFLRVSRFVDGLLVNYYNLPAFYNASSPRDLLGKHVVSLAPHTSAGVLSRIIGFTKVRGLLAHPYLHCACRRNADGDELAVMLLVDALLNFSRAYLPASRGGKMDAPLVLTVELDPLEVDDEAHAMDCCWSYPLEFYEAALRFFPPGEVKAVETIAGRLGSEAQFEGIGFTHAASLEGAPVQSAYVRLGNMAEKLEKELELMKRIRAVDAAGVAERILLSHFFPDLYGNLRSFSRQSFRCVECNMKFRRVPLAGKCRRCGGKLLLTINRGGVEKYLRISKEVVEKYGLPNYLKQRLVLLEKEIASIFENEQVKQVTLAEFV